MINERNQTHLLKTVVVGVEKRIKNERIKVGKERIKRVGRPRKDNYQSRSLAKEGGTRVYIEYKINSSLNNAATSESNGSWFFGFIQVTCASPTPATSTAASAQVSLDC